MEKRKSAIDGRGLFARESISSGEVVVVKVGYVLTRAQRDQIGALLGPSEIQITEDLFIGPSTRREREGGMMHLNHSSAPKSRASACWRAARSASNAVFSVSMSSGGSGIIGTGPIIPYRPAAMTIQLKGESIRRSLSPPPPAAKCAPDCASRSRRACRPAAPR